jgi:hypothetical protein
MCPRRSYYRKHKSELLQKQRIRRANKNKVFVFSEEVQEFKKKREKDQLDPFSEGFQGANPWQ